MAMPPDARTCAAPWPARWEPAREHDACGIGFLASRKGVAERRLVDIALGLCRQFDHRGAPGHGAGLLLDIPWALLLDRFPEHARVIANRDAALGMFFLPFDAAPRAHCVEMVEELASLAGADILGWADVPLNVEALPPGSAARRTAPVVRQALFRRPDVVLLDLQMPRMDGLALLKQIRERVPGVGHRDVFQSCLNLAACLLHQNKLEEALAFMQRAAETLAARLSATRIQLLELSGGQLPQVQIESD